MSNEKGGEKGGNGNIIPFSDRNGARRRKNAGAGASRNDPMGGHHIVSGADLEPGLDDLTISQKEYNEELTKLASMISEYKATLEYVARRIHFSLMDAKEKYKLEEEIGSALMPASELENEITERFGVERRVSISGEEVTHTMLPTNMHPLHRGEIEASVKAQGGEVQSAISNVKSVQDRIDEMALNWLASSVDYSTIGNLNMQLRFCKIPVNDLRIVQRADIFPGVSQFINDNVPPDPNAPNYRVKSIE